MSNKIHVYIETVITYVMRTALETGYDISLLQVNVPHAAQLAEAPVDIKYDRNVITCVEGKDLIESPSFKAFKAIDLLKLFEIWAFMCCGCSLVLLSEVAYDRYFPKIRPKKRVRVTKNSSTKSKHGAPGSQTSRGIPRLFRSDNSANKLFSTLAFYRSTRIHAT